MTYYHARPAIKAASTRRRAVSRGKGIFCLEIGEWFGTLKRKHTVEPVLEFLKQSPLGVRFIHRDVATRGELGFYLRKWTQARHANYPILYLAFHGRPGEILLADECGRTGPVTVADLSPFLSGNCHRRIIHFGACSVLNLRSRKVREYVHDWNALAMTGYACEVDWVMSSVFDALFLAVLQDNPFTRSGVLAVAKRMKTIASTLNRELGFRVVVDE
jgi:hypothetical protein